MVSKCPPIIKLLQVQPFYVRNRFRCSGSNLVCCTNRLVDPPVAPVCGTRLQYNVLGGVNAKPGEFPWMALLQYTLGKLGIDNRLIV